LKKKRVGLICDRVIHDGQDGQRAHDSYIVAVRDGAGALPLLIPALDPPLSADELVGAFDGFVFTGAVSNVDPKRYGGHAPRRPDLLDTARDEVSLALIRVAIAAGKPVLCICRGFQELNVALGGTLHQHVQELPGRLDHREDEAASLDVQFGPAHLVSIVPGGLLGRIAGVTEAHVNSLHHQGIDRLAPTLKVEATAPDGQIEAVSMPEAPGMVLGVQWHPEWQWSENTLSRAIFAAFGQAVVEYQ
jgi:putative glutamine amidotransferase